MIVCISIEFSKAHQINGIVEFVGVFSIAPENSEVKWKIGEFNVKNGTNIVTEFSELKNQPGRVIMAKALRNGDRT